MGLAAQWGDTSSTGQEVPSMELNLIPLPHPPNPTQPTGATIKRKNTFLPSIAVIRKIATC